MQETTQARLSHRQVMVVMAGLASGMLLAALDQTIVATALPTIVGELGGLEHLSWVVTAYLLTSTASVPLYGKISDLYGRRIVFQAAIVIFLVGSALSGAAQSMIQLILARGVQGIGAGGLMAMTMTIVGDIVAPRERGRYQGFIGAIFAVSSVAGPLIGGFFVDHLTWRWVFYVNLPVGVVSLIVTSVVLKLPFVRRPHRIDFIGAALMVAGVSCLLLAAVWVGDLYQWSDPVILGLVFAGIALSSAFLFWERRADEPILPLELFRNSIFTIASATSFLMGASLFGAIIFLPVFLQTVLRMSATHSGLLLAPMMFGLIASSIIVGRVISRTGRYKAFPIAGFGLATVGMLLFSRLEASTSTSYTRLSMVVLGIGIGMVMPVMILAVQNAVEHKDLGAATSAINFFRSIGGTFGVAVFGAVFAMRFRAELAVRLPRGSGIDLAGESLIRSPKAISSLPPAIQQAVVGSIAEAVHWVFVAAVPLVALGFLVIWALKEIPLRETAHVGVESLADEVG